MSSALWDLRDGFLANWDLLLETEINKTAIESRAWISKYIHIKQWDVMTHPCWNLCDITVWTYVMSNIKLGAVITLLNIIQVSMKQYSVLRESYGVSISNILENIYRV